MNTLKILAACFSVLVGLSTLSGCIIDREHYYDREHHDRRDRYNHHHHDHDHDHDRDDGYR